MAVKVVDLFCGVGGLTCGMRQAGFNVVAGFDNDKTCDYTYSHNNAAAFHWRNIKEVTPEEINECYGEDAEKILVGCAPCQPFSAMSYKRFKKSSDREEDEKYNLLSEFGRLIKDVKPIIVSMENVPEIRKTKVFKSFVELLKQNGYYTDEGQIVYMARKLFMGHSLGKLDKTYTGNLDEYLLSEGKKLEAWYSLYPKNTPKNNK